MSCTTTWKCDACGKLSVSAGFPSGWWEVSYPVFTGTGYGKNEKRDICDECEKKIPRLSTADRSRFEIKNGDVVLKEPSSEIDRLKCELIETRIELAKTPKFKELLNDMATLYEGMGNASTVLREIAKQLPEELGG